MSTPQIWAAEDAPAATEDSSDLEDRLLAHELRSQRARWRAREILDAERRGPMPPFDLGTLREVLHRPQSPPSRVDGLIPWLASTLLSAQRKTGKTTAALNLARSLLDGSDYLGRFPVRPLGGDVAMLNYEVSAAQLARWAADAGVPADRLHLVNLRGRRNPLASPEDRERLASLLLARGVETIICDPFGRAYTGTSQNDAGEVGAFLAELDRFARAEVGALDLVLTAHAGWNAERTRGSTALEDWADVVISISRDEAEDGDGERYLRAFGRDVDVEEDRLIFHADTRTLTLAGAGSRKAARVTRRHDELDQAVLDVVTATPGLSTSAIGERVRSAGVGFQRGDIGHAAGRLVEQGLLHREDGPRGARIYFPAATYPDPSRPLPLGNVGPIPTPPYREGIGPGDRSGPTYPDSRCQDCGEPMVVIEDGQTTHPNCDRRTHDETRTHRPADPSTRRTRSPRPTTWSVAPQMISNLKNAAGRSAGGLCASRSHNGSAGYSDIKDSILLFIVRGS